VVDGFYRYSSTAALSYMSIGGSGAGDGVAIEAFANSTKYVAIVEYGSCEVGVGDLCVCVVCVCVCGFLCLLVRLVEVFLLLPLH